jgi:hypothetical protein
MTFSEWRLLRESLGTVPLAVQSPTVLGLINNQGGDNFDEAKKGKKVVKPEDDETGDGEVVEPKSEKDKDETDKKDKKGCGCSKKSKKKMWGDNDDAQPEMKSKFKKPGAEEGDENHDEEPEEDEEHDDVEGDESEEGDEEHDDDVEGDESEENEDDDKGDVENKMKKPMKPSLDDKKPLFSKKNSKKHLKKESSDILDSLKRMMRRPGLAEDALIEDPNQTQVVDLEEPRKLDGLTFDEWSKQYAGKYKRLTKN